MLEPTPGDPRTAVGKTGIGSSSGSISFEDFTATTLAAVAKVINDNRGNDHPLFRNPWITMGIVWRPDFPQNPQFPGKDIG
jgi:hypothetical protein